jgi:hypothetical protein
LDLTYRKSSDNWLFDDVKVKKSTLPQGQDAVAQRCIKESARATTFPVDSKQELEKAAEEFIVRLGGLFRCPRPALRCRRTRSPA